MSDTFSADYLSARARFREAAESRGAQLEALPIDQVGPSGEALTIDVAILGSTTPRRAVVISSGVHGVEGYFGSAVQVDLLERSLLSYTAPDDCALVFLHAVNPYGFAWSRRFNEKNADLNRSFLAPGEAYSGSPDGYDALSDLINPQHPPTVIDRLIFFPKALFHIIKHGMPAMKQAVASGQYDHPKGLFFGGSEPTRTQELLDEHLPRWVGGCERVIHIDFHTGLGASATYKMFVDHNPGDPGDVELKRIFGAGVVEPWNAGGTAYAIRGGLGTWCKTRLPNVNYDVLAAEFGTYPALKVLAALRQENQAHHWGDAHDPTTASAKSRLREVFAPTSQSWRDAVVARGTEIVHTAMDSTFDV
ncbi:MAG: hypothetical protein ACI9MC_002624 [Kiritimatiellia bacterium]|jgi:hypothetical protein